MEIKLSTKVDLAKILYQNEKVLGNYYFFYQKQGYQVAAFNPKEVYLFEKGFTSLSHLKRDEDFRTYSDTELNQYSGDPIGFMKEELKKHQSEMDQVPATPFFKGGFAGAITFEGLSKLLEVDMAKATQQPISMGWFDTYIVRDISSNTVYIVMPDENEELGKYIESLILMETKNSSPEDKVQTLHPKNSLDQFATKLKSNPDAIKSFENQVSEIRDCLKKGESFQTVLSHQLTLPSTDRPFDAFIKLSKNNSTYKFIFKSFDTTIVGISPENLFVLEDGLVSMTPLAGTRPITEDHESNVKNESELSSCVKENAEHTMLVDLVRSDLGRVCNPGSVAVNKYKYIDKYREVMHLASDVVGSLDENKDAFDLLRAVSPAGTMSGAPKVRSIEIINKTENKERGFYSGNIGIINADGSSDFSIIIRSVIFKNGFVQLQAGAGIVLDSIAENEFDECITKMYSCGKEVS